MNCALRLFVIALLQCVICVLSAPDPLYCRKLKDSPCIKLTECSHVITASQQNKKHGLQGCGFGHVCCPGATPLEPAPTTEKQAITTPEDLLELRSRDIASAQCEKYIKRLEKRNENDDRVLFGEDAQLGEFPHMVALGGEDGNGNLVYGFCGGTLISENYVLTAAHCQKKDRNLITKVKLGFVDLTKTENAVEVDIKTHKLFSSDTKKHDIMLIELKNNVNFTKNIQPACLRTMETNPPNVIVTGWGAVHRDDNKQRKDVLQKATIQSITNEDCEKKLGSKLKPELRHFLCLLDQDGKKDSCVGDSGGPAQVLKDINSNTYELVGIVATGNNCGGINNPGIYTKVSKYIRWIEDNVWGQ